MSALDVTSGTHEHKLIRASRVEHVPVFNDRGDRIGHIDDLSIDRVTGQVIYAIMSFGGFLGIGKRFHPLPWNALHYDPGMDGYIVNLDRDQMNAAPHYSSEELAELTGPAHREHKSSIYRYYGLGPPFG